MNILGIIPARGGSKGVPNKNILKLYDKPLIAYTIESALESKLLDNLVISTDSKKIANVVSQSYDLQIIDRPSKLAQDDSPIEEALLHAVEYLIKTSNYHADIVVWMQPNVPIRDNGIIDKAISNLMNSDADSCISCYEVTQKPELMKIINSDGYLEPCEKDVGSIRRQEFPKRYMADGSVIVLRTKNLFKYKGIRKAHIYMGEKVIPLVQTKRMYSVEIDDFEDCEMVELYMENLFDSN